MTDVTLKEIVKKLYLKDSNLFFEKLESVPDESILKNPFIYTLKNAVYDEVSQKWITHFELKDEFKELIKNSSLVEILQIVQSVDNKDLKSIKNWVTFFGIITVIGLIVGIIAALDTAS